MGASTANIRIGDELPPVSLEMTQDRMTLFAKQLGKRYQKEEFINPMNFHTDLDCARSAGLPATIVQALHYYALLSRISATLFGRGWLSGGKMSVSFIKMMYSGDTVTAKASVTGISREGACRRITLDVWCENRAGEKVAVGTASGLAE